MTIMHPSYGRIQYLQIIALPSGFATVAWKMVLLPAKIPQNDYTFFIDNKQEMANLTISDGTAASRILRRSTSPDDLSGC
jgi:hypothetical protein